MLYLGGIQQLRGLDLLVRALAERDDLALVMMGPGSDSYRAELEALAAAAGWPTVSASCRRWRRRRSAGTRWAPTSGW